MLTQMRKGANSWVAKVFMALMALSFVAWGVGDIFRGRHSTTVASVAGVDINVQQLQTEYRNNVQRLQSSGINVEQGTDLSRAVAGLALNDLVQRALYRVTAADMGVTIGDRTLRDDIAGNSMFQDSQGRFSATTFADVLRNNGLSEQSYVTLLRQQIADSQLRSAIGALPVVPQPLLNDVYSYRNEQRTAELAVIPNDALAKAPEPTQSELESYFKANIQKYRAPEYRSGDYISIYPSDLAGQMTVTDAELKKAYEADKAKWVKPERRHLLRIAFQTKKAAEAARARIMAGEDFAKVAHDTTGVAPASVDIGWNTKSDLFPKIADPVFALSKGEVSKPIASPLGGWLLFKVTEIQPQTVTPFAEAKPEIVKRAKLQKASDAMYNMANNLDDMLAAGDSIKQAAKALGLKAKTVTLIDKNGHPENPKSLEVLPDAPEFLPQLFKGTLNFASQVIETKDGGVLAVEVTKIVAAHDRKLSEVKDQVVADWRAAKLAELAHKAAEATAKTVTPDHDLAKAFAADNVKVTELQPFHRTDTPKVDGVGLDTVTALFAAKPGQVVVTPSTDGKSQVVARLLKVLPADPKADPGGYQKMGNDLTSALVSDIDDEFRALMRQNHTVSIDHSMIQQYF